MSTPGKLTVWELTFRGACVVMSRDEKRAAAAWLRELAAELDQSAGYKGPMHVVTTDRGIEVRPKR